MSEINDDVDYVKVFFGPHAIRVACRFVLQDAGTVPNGQTLTLVTGYVVSNGPILSEKAREIPSPHELIVGDLVLRPHAKYTGKNFLGSGVEHLITGGSFDPEEWDVKSF